MADFTAINKRGENAILARLSPADYERIWGASEVRRFGVRDVLYRPHEPIEHVYFPLTGVMSLVIPLNDSPPSEVGTIGNEGLLGTPVFLGGDRSPIMAFSQVSGDAVVMPVQSFREELRNGSSLYERVQRHTQAWFAQVAQGTACNNLHPVEQRMCRWLLMTQDRVGEDRFELTQDFLAQMLGVRRPSVTVVAGMLQRAGLITYGRGVVTITDRPALESASCECYAMVRDEYARLLA